MRACLVMLVGLLVTTGAQAQDYTGTYSVAVDSTITVTVVLRQGLDKKLTGTLAAKGDTYSVEGIVDSGVAVGAVRTGGSGFFFEAHLNGERMEFTIVEPDAQGKPNIESARHLVFNRTSRDAPLAAAPFNPPITPAPARPAPATPPPPEEEPAEVKEWRTQLAGKRGSTIPGNRSRERVAGDAGFTEGTETYFCSSGAFSQRDRNLVGTGSEVGVTGRWQVRMDGERAVLELKFDDGRFKLHRLTRADGRLFVDGQRLNLGNGLSVCR